MRVFRVINALLLTSEISNGSSTFRIWSLWIFLAGNRGRSDIHIHSSCCDLHGTTTKLYIMRLVARSKHSHITQWQGTARSLTITLGSHTSSQDITGRQSSVSFLSLLVICHFHPVLHLCASFTSLEFKGNRFMECSGTEKIFLISDCHLTHLQLFSLMILQQHFWVSPQQHVCR